MPPGRHSSLGCRVLKNPLLPASPSSLGLGPGTLPALAGTLTLGLQCLPIPCCQSRNNTKIVFLRKSKVSTQPTAFWLHASQL